MQPDIRASSGPHYTVGHFGPFADMGRYEIDHPKLNVKGKVFLRKPLGFTGMEISLNRLPAGAAIPFLHRHETHEEAYIFVKGTGQIQVDGKVLDVSEGTVVRIAPPASRTWRNNSEEDLYYVVVQAKANTFAADEKDGALVADPIRW